jgi:hypothetical protein
MSITELIKGHETAVISGSFALLGVALTLAANSIQKFFENRHSLKLKRLELAIELEKKHLLEPVIEFLDYELSAMQAVYSIIFVKKEDRANVRIDNTHWSKFPSIEARIRGLGDNELNHNFHEFSLKRIKIATAIKNPDMIESKEEHPFEQLQEAIELGGKVLKSLFHKLKELEYK